MAAVAQPEVTAVHGLHLPHHLHLNLYLVLLHLLPLLPLPVPEVRHGIRLLGFQRRH